MPKRGYGQFRKMASFLSINSVNVTQIFKGERDLSLEQACLLADYFGLSELESQYFVSLVEHERAGHHKLKQMIQKRLDEILAKSQNLKQRLTSSTELSDEGKATFYSSWSYSAIRLLSSIDDYNDPDSIAKYFNLPLAKVNRAIEFLLQNGLCKELPKTGHVTIGSSSTHLEASSPLIARHHSNWRLKAIERYDRLSSEELCLSMPCSLSDKALVQIRKELVACIERISNLIDAGPEEKLACLNIDWFRF